MDALMLSRLQFAIATFFHFIFVPLTLGLSIMVAIMQTRWQKTGDETYKRMTKFWGKLFLINFALGVVTGITLEFQFGTNWARYSAYVGDVFGSLLAIEATLAFFLESTFLGIWIFGWNRVSPKLHLASIWLVAIASNVSAFWILTANAWMQNPVGYVLRNGRAELANFSDLLLNTFGWQQFVHTLSASYALAGFFVLGISAWHILRKNEPEFFKRSFKMGATAAALFSVVVSFQGHMHAAEVAQVQPTKMAAMDAHWETQTWAPQYLIAWPDAANERNAFEALPIPGLLSFLAHHDPRAEVKGLKDFPKEDRPPVLLTFLSFRTMVFMGVAMLGLGVFAYLKRERIEEYPGVLKALIWFIPVPYLAIQFGWIVAEVGRQPWIVWGIMRTRDAVSPAITSGQVGFSMFLMTAMYFLLTGLDLFLLKKYATKGPAPVGVEERIGPAPRRVK